MITIDNTLSFAGSKDRIKELLEAIAYDYGSVGTIDFNKIIPLPPECSFEQAQKAWGTKWNSLRPANGVYFKHDCLFFRTANGQPSPVIAKLAEMYPDINITHTYTATDNDIIMLDYYRDGKFLQQQEAR